MRLEPAGFRWTHLNPINRLYLLDLARVLRAKPASTFAQRALGILAILGGMLLLCCARAEAAGFDCAKATSRLERLICEDPILDSLDTQLDGAYRGALDRSNDPSQLKAMQQAWLKTRDACADATCLSAAYLQQIGILSRVSDEPPICARSMTDDEINACAVEYSRRADSELGRYLAVARKRLLDEASEASKDALREFDASQAAWVAYRKAECGAVYDWWRDGTVRFAMHEECWQAVTKARTATVWATWLGYVDHTPPLLPEPAK